MAEKSLWFKRFLAAILMVVYLVSAWDQGFVHLHHHAESNGALHDEHCETDACHRSIYHFGAEECGHKAHIIPAQEECYDCHQIVFIQYLDADEASEAIDQNIVSQVFAGKDICVLQRVVDRNVRGPPVRPA